MADLNEVRLIGRLTRDPELRSTAGGQQICNFGLATGRKYKNGAGEQVEETTFVEVTCWAKLAENVARYMKKGSQIFIGGRLKFDSWEDKQSGQKRSRLTVTADNVQFLDVKKDSDGPAQQHNERPPKTVMAGMGEHDAPQDFENFVNEKNYGEPPF